MMRLSPIIYFMLVISLSACRFTQCARARNMEVIRASLRRSNLNFDEGVEQCAHEDISVHAEEANPSIPQVSSRDLCETSIQRAPKQDLGHLIRNNKLRCIPAASSQSSTRGCILLVLPLSSQTNMVAKLDTKLKNGVRARPSLYNMRAGITSAPALPESTRSQVLSNPALSGRTIDLRPSALTARASSL